MKVLDLPGLKRFNTKINALIDKRIEKAMISHVLDSTNTSMVLGADVGPKITQLVNNVDTRVDRLNSDLVWKLAFSVQGVGDCNLPSAFKELLIIANTGTSYNTFIYIPFAFLKDQWQNFSTSHYVTQADNSFIGFKATKSLISLVTAYTNNGTESSSLCSYSVYYR